MSSSVKCYLLNLETGAKINLPHGQLKQIGRNEETGIQDLYLSKNQIECIADTELYQIKLKCIGRPISCIDGYAMMKNKVYIAGPGQKLELRIAEHVFETIFESTSEEDITQAVKKQKLDFPIFNFAQENGNKNGEKHISDIGKWEDVGGRELLIYTSANCEAKTKIAAFDIDGTIIKPKSGARFPKDINDWQLCFPDIVTHLKKLVDDGFKIVFFTNQSRVGKDPNNAKQFKTKIENIISKISLPVQVYIATGKSIYRKPTVGMWNVLVDLKNDGVPVDKSNSFYVGDAAGRQKNWAPKKNKDHSKADRLFALNIGINFFTPEEYFLKAKPVSYLMPDFDPRDLPTATYPEIKYDKRSIIIMVGSPGSGKSYFCSKVLLPMGYIHINRDKLGSWQKCVKVLEENLQRKENCVVDNTNPDRQSRSRYIEVARKCNVDCYCFVMSPSIQHSKHNNKFRELTDSTHVPVTDIIINSYNKHFEEPEKTEGFKEIVRVPFIPEFKNGEHERLYKMFLLEN